MNVAPLIVTNLMLTLIKAISVRSADNKSVVNDYRFLKIGLIQVKDSVEDVVNTRQGIWIGWIFQLI